MRIPKRRINQSSQGAKGDGGSRGTQGPQGSKGTHGAQGAKGATGPQGEKGDTGGTGQSSQGAKGDGGSRGTQGPQGSKGTHGPQGAIGVSGVQGMSGAAGLIGINGSIGYVGATGEVVTIGKLTGNTQTRNYLLGHTDSASTAVSFATGQWWRNIGVYVDSGKTVYATSFYETSDERLKDFHNDVEIDFEKISRIPKKYFEWKDNPGKMQIGTSAQAVQKLYPEIVNYDGTYTLSYDKLSIIALAAIDKLHKRVKELEEQLRELKK